MGILYAILIFGLIILVHELGHFFAARWAGVKVISFAIGMGPAILKWQGKETLYALRLFPLGGYCQMADEEEEPESPRAFQKQPIYKRAIIMASGAMMNILLALVLMLAVVGLRPLVPTNIVADFMPDAISSQQLRVDDEILRVGGIGISGSGDLGFALMRSDLAEGVNMVVRRDGERMRLENVMFPSEEVEGGREIFTRDFRVYGNQRTVWNVMSGAFNDTVSVIRITYVSLHDIVTGRFALNELSGPVGITQQIGQTATQAREHGLGITPLLYMAAFISINLGVVNLLPLPVLDGGRLVLLGIEKIRKKPLPKKAETVINMIGLGLLLMLFVFVTFNDVFRLFG